MCSTRGAWLPGDERGFRSRHHRIHSTGDYRSPPPVEEHAGLRRTVAAMAHPFVRLTPAVRPTIAKAFAEKFRKECCLPVLVAVAETHIHALISVGKTDAKRIVGRAKQYASHQVRESMPGKIWGQGCHVVRVRDRSHFRVIIEYINEHERAEGAFVWRNPDLRFAQLRRRLGKKVCGKSMKERANDAS